MKAIVVLFSMAFACAAGDASAAALSCTPSLNAPQTPFRIYGNTYYVGTHELSAILITSDQGHVLIDGDLAESAPQIERHIRALGFRLRDVKLILNSHVHFDHAGGLAALQHFSGARVAASRWSASVLRTGRAGPGDPQFDIQTPIAAVAKVEVVEDGQTVHVGPLALSAHLTPGHTPGGTSWTWTSCENGRCLHIVYADSLTAVSSDTYRFSDHRDLLAGFEKSFATLDALPCDILLTPHPGFSGILDKLEARQHGRPDAFIAADSCRNYAQASRKGLEQRLAKER